MSIDQRLRRLETRPANRNMGQAFSKIYDALKEAELKSTGCPDDARFGKEWVKRFGTQMDFVKIKMERWHKQHGNRRDFK